MQVGTCPNMLGYMSLPNLIPQRQAVDILGIKLSHLAFLFLQENSG
jgi:hypothetical protein